MTTLVKKAEGAPVAAEAPTDELDTLRDGKFEESIGELEKLLAQTHRAFLLGAGCSRCA